jgi:hypothetical protein
VIFKKFLFALTIGLMSSFVLVAQKEVSSQTKAKKDTSLLKRKAIKPSVEPQSTGPKKRTYSKIINDSSKNIYGPKTTLWTTEGELFSNQKNYRSLDTTINNFHRWNYVQGFANRYQDLGNVGTALNPIYPIVSATIGASTGFKSYQPYYDTEEPHYYDSKSPFTRIYLVWAGNGRAMSHIEFTRNINSRWNFGFNYRPMLVDKQIQYKKNDRQTTSHYYDFFTTYKSKNERYLVAFTYRRIKHRVKENGGVLLEKKDTTYNAYFDVNAKPAMTTAESEEWRQSFHLYQQYQLAKPMQVYLISDYKLQSNSFRMDNTIEPDKNYFKVTIVDSTKTSDVMDFKTFQNEVGVKGNAAFLFYNFYYKHRSVSNSIPLLQGYDPRASSSISENYLGARIGFRLDSVTELRGSLEYLMDGNYKLEGALSTPWLNASLISSLTKPGYLQRAYRGSHNYWRNNFANSLSNQLNGYLKFSWRGIYVSPGLTYTLLSNYIFFKEYMGAQQPVQSTGTQQVFSPELNMSVRFARHFFLKPQVIYTQLWKNDDEALRIPELFMNVQLAYENIFFTRNLQIQMGLDVHYKSSYKALGYAPDIQSYYVQDSRLVEGFPLVDIFLNAKIKQGRLFIKYHNAWQIGKLSGYMLTYGYPAMSNILDFGFEIPLFD